MTEDTALPSHNPASGLNRPTTTSCIRLWEHCLAVVVVLLFSGSVSAQAPFMDVATQEKPAVEESIWPLVRGSMQLDHQISNERVQKELDWMREHPDFVQRLAPRMREFAPLIFREVDRRNLPAELLFLAMIESGLDPFAFSPGGAAGLWQFMPATGERFGLKIDWWTDERRDPVLATKAALDYLELLHRRFDNWDLAIAAYNAGEGRVSRAVRKAGSKNFSELSLPSETLGYLPRLLAFSEVFMDPDTYGLTLPHVSARVSQRVVDTGTQLDLTRAAEALDVSVEDLFEWNPALNQWATHPRGPHRLLIGKTDGDPQGSIDQIPDDERVAWQRHRIKSGETLSGLADRYRTDTRVLMQANELRSKVIHTGDTLLIPTINAKNTTSPPARRRDVGQKIYRVVRGDSLSEIAERFDVPLVKLMRLNHIGPKQYLRVGTRLIIPAANKDLIKKINYQVRSGDSLSGIAQRFNVTTREIMGWNELDLAKYLQPGQRLRLYVDLTAAN